MTETGREEIVWRPTREYAERTRLARFMRSLGVGSLEELQRRSIAEPDWYWDAVVRDLGLRFSRPYTRVRDVSRGVQWPHWFQGGLMNFADNCVDRHLDAGRGEQPALIWEGDGGRGRGGVAVRPPCDRLQAARARDPVDPRPRCVVARADRAGVGRLSRAARRVRSSVPDHLHVGNDGAAEGRGAHAGRLPAQVRARLRLPDGRRPGRPALLADRPRLADG